MKLSLRNLSKAAFAAVAMWKNEIVAPKDKSQLYRKMGATQIAGKPTGGLVPLGLPMYSPLPFECPKNMGFIIASNLTWVEVGTSSNHFSRCDDNGLVFVSDIVFTLGEVLPNVGTDPATDSFGSIALQSISFWSSDDLGNSSGHFTELHLKTLSDSDPGGIAQFAMDGSMLTDFSVENINNQHFNLDFIRGAPLVNLEIKNLPNIVGLNFQNITVASVIRIIDCPALEALDNLATGLTVGSQLSVRNTGVFELVLDSVTLVNAALNIEDNSALRTVDFAGVPGDIGFFTLENNVALESVTGIGSIFIGAMVVTSNAALTSIDLLGTEINEELSITDCNALEALDLSGASISDQCSIYSNAALANINLTNTIFSEAVNFSDNDLSADAIYGMLDVFDASGSTAEGKVWNIIGNPAVIAGVLQGGDTYTAAQVAAKATEQGVTLTLS